MPMTKQRLHSATDSRRVFAMVQARMGSTRLPGKVLADIEGRPMLARVVDRALKARTLQGVVVASSRSDSDDPIASSCEELGFTCFRGSVRITGDCPLIDPDLIDQAVGIFLAADPPWDLVANRLPEGRDFPVGLDIEVCGREALKTAWLEAAEPHQREHVLPFIYEDRDRFRVYRVRHKPGYGDMRWTVDEPADLELVRRVFSHFGGSDHFSWLDVIALFGEKPELREINADVVHRTHRHVG
jgi:spore coat polysaccharide biosynthesis protein SpsF